MIGAQADGEENMNQPKFGAGEVVRAARKVGLFWLCASSCLTLPSIALAQTTSTAPAANTLEEVVVTARRREERLQDVPIAVVAVSERQLEEKNIKNVNDLTVVAPGLSIQNTTGNRNNVTYSIRGQGQAFGQNSPGVVAYFAEVPDFSSAIFDLQSVQVLKGPQGTLFGRNTTGGAVLFSPQRPTETLSGYVVGRVGDLNRHDLEFAVGGPIIGDKLMVRVAGQTLNRDGYTKNLYNGRKLDDENRRSVRASVLLRPFDGFENLTIYQDDEVKESGSGSSLAFVAPNINNAPILSQLQGYLAAQKARGPRVINASWPDYTVLDGHGILNSTSLRLTDHITLKNIVSNRHYTGGQSYDLDSTPLDLLNVTNPPGKKIESTTEEFQIQASWNAVNTVVGYYRENTKSPVNVGFDTKQFFSAPVLGALAPPLALAFPNGVAIQAIAYGNSSNSSEAVFGQVDWKATQKLTLTGGIRRTEDYRRSFSQTFLVLPGQPVPTGPTATGPSSSGVFKATTWNVAANYTFTPNLSAYATVRRGYKSGGFNGTALSAADKYFQPEFVTDHEVGVKGQTTLGDMHFRYAVDAFYDDYTNIQRFINLPTTPASTVTRNAASGSIKGLDVDVAAQLAAHFDVSLIYTYMDASYDKYEDPVQGDLTSSRFPNTPKHQLTLTPRFTYDLAGDWGSLSALASIYYQSGMALDPANKPNGNPAVALSAMGANVPGYTRVDLRVDWRDIRQSPVSAAFYVRNAFDKDYVVGSNNQLSTQFGVGTFLYGAPRQVVFELRYAFH
ncbi:hypothetical protein CSW62_24910 [Caulobacter sp. FWC2]|nr:hypothetical protein CSW62_24910 [Caulobacter sp. FWC2]